MLRSTDVSGGKIKIKRERITERTYNVRHKRGDTQILVKLTRFPFSPSNNAEFGRSYHVKLELCIDWDFWGSTFIEKRSQGMHRKNWHNDIHFVVSARVL